MTPAAPCGLYWVHAFLGHERRAHHEQDSACVSCARVAHALVEDHAQGEVVQSAVGVVVTEPTALPVLSETAASHVCTRQLVYNLDELETDCS